ncbi:MAG: methyltransferase regulatory domain-containing protein [Desulfosarcina sp.]|nr:methyltransferase regulatory domain-containing protein [Desulfosarcina sp.]
MAEAYDMTPYAGDPYCLTHPSLLAAFGCLYGLSPTPPANCRVLEMGSGDGGNIIPMAYEFPKSEFIGIDLSPVQIGIGQKIVDSLELENILLETRSIMDMGSTDGKFDYIIVHGVYSWVPDMVKEKVLDICRNNLVDQGIAYISYNVLPGWQFNKSMRDMMLYRTRHIKDPKERTDTALDLVTTMLEATADSNRFYDVQLRFFGKTLQSFHDVSSYLLHDYMEADNDPFYFHEFAGALKNHGLQYICDAEQTDFELDSLPADAAAKFEEVSENALDVEQYVDFLKNTRFRHSIVCHEEIDVNQDYSLERIEHLFAATDVVPVLDSPDSPIKEATAFRTSGGRRFSTEHFLAQVTLRKLSEIKPSTIDIPSLIQAVKKEAPSELERDSKKQTEKIGHVVYALFFNGVLELLAAPRRCVLEISDCPTASPIARLLAPSRRVTNLMMEGVRTGRVDLPNHKEGREDKTRELIHNQLESILQHLPRCGVLVA